MALNVNIGIGPIADKSNTYINSHVLRVCKRLDHVSSVAHSTGLLLIKLKVK